MAFEAFFYVNEEVDPEDILTAALKLALGESGEDVAHITGSLLDAYVKLLTFREEVEPKHMAPDDAVALYHRIYCKVGYDKGHKPDLGDIPFPDAFPDGRLPRKFVVQFARATAQSDRASARHYRQWATSTEGKAQIAQWRAE